MLRWFVVLALARGFQQAGFQQRGKAVVYAENERVAVVVDCESVEAQGEPLDLLMVEVAQWGTALVRRAYGDMSTAKWRRALLDHAFTPVQDFTAPRTALVIDCMDLLFDRDIDAFVLVSNSGGLARLAMRIRETDRKVVGCGERHASRELVVACHQFVYLDNLGHDLELCDATAEKPKCLTGAELRQNRVLIELLTKAVRDNAVDGGVWATLAKVGHEILRVLPDFDSRDFGYAKLGDLFRATELFEVAYRGEKRAMQVRLRPDLDLLEQPEPEPEPEPRRAMV
ncbi:hypothetical protein CTAYLR_003497 [Chrysophaeum taylorii]|uniref:HTH OST-type domain-containing protein n=1 Tax=Chrysophaeum taylorii TaxID=2483200 RepID=A0AAD7UEH8_9STRA|nr:hypothetical protein CTAYLR_003497 [Chrysophaeum taylorii]